MGEFISQANLENLKSRVAAPIKSVSLAGSGFLNLAKRVTLDRWDSCSGDDAS